MPGSADVVYYNASSVANLSNWLASAFSIKGIAYSNAPTTVMPTNGISISSTNSGLVLTLNGNGIDMSLAASNLTFNLPVALGASQSWLVRSNQTLAFSNVVSGSGSVTNSYSANASTTAPGTIFLSGANTFTGALVANGGRIMMANAAALGSAAGLVTVNNGGQINWSNTYTIGKSFQVAGTGLLNDGALRAGGSSASTINGNITLLADATALKMDTGSSFTLNGLITAANHNLTISLDGTATSTLNGALQLGTGGFTKAGTGTLVLNAPTNTWTGGTTIGGGGLTVGTGNYANLGTGTIVNNGTLTFNTLNYITVNDLVSGTGSLVQNGLSTLTLAGANTYSGNTTVGANSRINVAPTGWIPNTFANTITVNAGGTLDLSALGNYTLGSSQTLAGSGTILGADTSAGTATITALPGATVTGSETIYGGLAVGAGAKVYPGGNAAAGTLTVNGTLSLNSSLLYYDLSMAATEGSGINDEIVVTGNLNLTGTTVVSLATLLNGALSPGGVYKLIHYGGAKLGPGTLVFDQPNDGLTIDTTSQPGYVLLVVSASPTATLTWLGDGSLNQWDLGVTTPWTNKATLALSPFTQFDNVLFDDTGAAAPTVSIVTNVRPASIVVEPASTYYTLSGPGKISGSASVLMNSGTTFAIQTTNNDYKGPTIVQQGTLSIQDLGTFSGAGGISISNGATLEFQVNVPSSANGLNLGSTLLPSIVGGGTLLKDGAGTLNLGGQGNASYKINLKLGPAATIDVENGAIRNGGWQGGVWTDGATWTNLSSLTVNGSGIFDIWDGNAVYVDALNGNGTVQIGYNSAAAHTLYLGVNNGSGVFNGTVSAPTGTSALNLIKLGSGTQEIDRFTGISAAYPIATINGGTLTLAGSADNAYAQAIVNNGALLQLQKTSSLTAHSLGGGTSLTVNSNGVARVTGTGNSQIYYGNTILINAGGLFDLNGNNETIGSITGYGLIDNANVSFPSTLYVGGNTANTTGSLTVNLTNSGMPLTLVKNGTGTTTVLSSNLFATGGIIVSNGTLQFGNGIVNAVPPSDVGLNGGTLSFVVATNTSVTVNGNITNSPSASGAFYENGFGGTVYLGGANTFLGGINVNAGALWINNSSALGSTSVAKTITLANGTAGNPSLHLNGTNGNITLPALFSLTTSWVGGTLFNEAGNNVISGPITLTSGGGDTYIVVNNGSLTLNGLVQPNTTGRNLRLGGPGNGIFLNGTIQDNGANTLTSLIKEESGTWTLDGANPTTAATLVQGGTLALGPQGTLSKTTNINVSAGATFDVSQPASYNTSGFWTNNGGLLLGAGTVNGSVVVAANTTIQPGGNAAFGTLTFANHLALGPTVTNQFELGSSLTPGAGQNDLIVVGGNLDPQNAVITISPLQPITTGVYELFSYAGAHLSSFNPAVVNPTRYVVTLDELSTPNQVLLDVTGANGNLTWYGNGNYNWDNNINQTWNLNTIKFLALDAVTFDDTSKTGTVNTAGTLLPVSITVNNTQTNYTIQGSGIIGGVTGLTKTGTGSLRINTANTFLGPVNVSAGTLMAGSATPFGATNGIVTIASGATVDVNNQNLGLKPFVVSGTGVGGAGAIINSSATRQQNAFNTLTLAGDTTFGGVGGWDLRANGVPFAFLSSMGNPVNITKIAANQVSVVSAMVDPAIANITVNSGIFSFEGNSTGLGNPTNTLMVATNATLQFWAPTNLVNKLIVLNGGTANSLIAGSGTASVISPMTLNYTNIFNISGTALNLNGPVVESTPAGLVKIGAGILTLAGTNAWSGSTVVTAGTLNLGNGGIGGNVGLGPVILNGGSTLQFNRADDFTWANDCSQGTNGTIIKLGTDTVTVVSTNLCAGNDQVNGGTLILSTNAYLTSGNQFWIAQNATTGACIINGGTLISSNWIAAGRNNVNSLGSFTLNSGSIVKNGPGNLIAGSLGGNGTITVNGGTISNNSAIWLGETASQGVGVLNLNGGFVQASQVTRAANAGKSSIARFNGGTLQAITNQLTFFAIDQTLVQAGGLVFDDGGNLVTISQPLLADVTSPGGGLTKVGSGTLTLTAANTYTGTTVVQAGTLVVSGSVAGSATVTGGTLTGSGSIAGALTVASGGNLAPGALIGNLTVGSSAVLQPGSTTFVEVSADWGINSELTASAITYGGTLVVNNIGFTALTNGMTFPLFNAAAYHGSFANILPASPGLGLAWDTSDLAVNGTLKIGVATVPPSQPVFSSSTRLPGGGLQLNFSGTPGAAYRVWSSKNLALKPFMSTWSVISSGTFTASPASYIDSTTNAANFYIITCP